MYSKNKYNYFLFFSLIIIVEQKPEILMAIYNIFTNTLIVMWSTTIEDIINIVVIAKNTESGNEYSVVVGQNERTVEVAVDPAPYNVTVVLFDNCGKNYSSLTFFVEQHIDPSSTMLSGTILQSNASMLTTFEKTSVAETPSHHFTLYTSAHLLSFDTPGSSIHYSSDNTGN